MITDTKENKEVLLSLLLFDNLPAREEWKHFLPSYEDIDISPLIRGVARTLDHQSQESTDCRWLWIMTFMITGTAKIHDKEIIEGIFYYPNRGDMRKIRPHIRAMESAFSLKYKDLSDWPRKFWQEALDKTECYHLPSTQCQHHLNIGTSLARVNEVYQALRH